MTVLKPLKKDAIYEDLKALPENMIGQIIAGELYAMPRPATSHARTSSVLGVELMGPFDRGKGGPGGWLMLDEPELHLGQDVLVPDLAGWKRERMPTLKAAPWIDLAPDWICEVLSPSTASIDRVRRKHVYAREKVRWYWLVDPEAKTLEALEPADTGRWLELGAWSSEECHERVRGAPFDAIELELKALWLE